MTLTGIRRVILPLDSESDEDRLLLPATVLASWFGAHLQLVTGDPRSVPRYAVLADGLGIPTEPVVQLAGDAFLSEVADHAGANGPSICVMPADARGKAVALSNSQPTFLMAEEQSHRLAAGPLVVPLTGGPSDLDVLALAATWAKTVEVPVRIVAAADDASTGDEPRDANASDRMIDHISSARERLEQMGVDVTVDHLLGTGIDPIMLMASSRSATAVVVAADRVSAGFVNGSGHGEVSILVAPANENAANTATTEAPDLSRSGPRRTASSLVGFDALDHQACMTLLARQTVGRLGYIDDGWPIVVTVNFVSTDDGIVIRSLPGGKLFAALRGDVVCLQADYVNPRSKSGWSVLVHGPLEVISDPQSLRLAWENDPEPWVDSDSWEWLRLRPLSATGRTVT